MEKPTAHTMPDARAFLAAVKQTGKIVQVGTQRRSTPSYQKAYEYIQSGKFGDIVMVEMTWNEMCIRDRPCRGPRSHGSSCAVDDR